MAQNNKFGSNAIIHTITAKTPKATRILIDNHHVSFEDNIIILSYSHLVILPSSRSFEMSNVVFIIFLLKIKILYYIYYNLTLLFLYQK
jgi:hypothetical protein